MGDDLISVPDFSMIKAADLLCPDGELFDRLCEFEVSGLTA